MKRIVCIVFAFFLFSLCRAEEGMWIPMLLRQYNIEDMQKKGFKLTAEDIYAINQASLKDAIIGLGREGSPFHHFCTGELISDKGLVVTNHHCSFDMIQNHSSLEHNYLKDGFWARNLNEELANPGITASILVRMEDVTSRINAALKEGMSEEERSKVIRQVAQQLEKEAVAGTNLSASVKPYFNGNQYFMSVFKIYKDVRLVGAPPSAIGKFGGDTDNWMWPRHTGDFSVLRIYADTNNEPASFSLDNRPYQPAKFLTISARGIQEGDFTMVFGYPGTTQEYLTSYAIEQLTEVENPHKVAIRTAKLNIMNEAMNRSELLRIKYAAKAAGVANAWKKWQGEMKGLKRFRTIESKKETEHKFVEWAQQHPEYAGLMENYKQLYQKRRELVLASVYAQEAGKRGAEIIGWATQVYKLLENYASATDREIYRNQCQEFVADYYKDYDVATDKAILAEMVHLYITNLPEKWLPDLLVSLKQKGNYREWTQKIVEKSILAQPEAMMMLIRHVNKDSYKKLKKDPVYELAVAINDFYAWRILPELSAINRQISQLDRLWIKVLMEMNPEKLFYPDANSTLRVAYGKIGGYSPVDAVNYKYYTTLTGIMEKDNPAIYDYDVPAKLREVYRQKDYGKYAQNGEIPVCFLATNHTTGGNSGSPVLNGDGQLLGINFDRAWDGVMSDMQYEPAICRNIAVDIRYVLFVIDKVAEARNLLDEMVIVY